MFGDSNDIFDRTMRRIAAVFEKYEISYAVVTGMEIDFLTSEDGFAKIVEIARSEAIRFVPDCPRKIQDVKTGITFDLLIAGEFPRKGDVAYIAYPDPILVSHSKDHVTVVNLKPLIEMKLAAARFQDFADVVNLIRLNDLDESFQNQLHPSVRDAYIKCLEGKRREDEYERRQDRAVEELFEKLPSGEDVTK